MIFRGKNILRVLLLLVLCMVAVGCNALPREIERAADGKLVYTSDDDTWSWVEVDGSANIQLNDKDFARVYRNTADVTLPGGDSVTVALDRQNEPVSVQAAWGVELAAGDYTLIEEALEFHTLAGGIQNKVPWVGIIFLLLVMLLFVLAAVRADIIADWLKTNGLSSSFTTGRAMFLVRLISIVLAAVFLILLLVVLF